MISPAVSSQAVADIDDTRHKSLRFAGICLFCFPQLSVAEQSLKFVTLPLDLQVSNSCVCQYLSSCWHWWHKNFSLRSTSVWLLCFSQPLAAKQSLKLVTENTHTLPLDLQVSSSFVFPFNSQAVADICDIKHSSSRSLSVWLSSLWNYWYKTLFTSCQQPSSVWYWWHTHKKAFFL